MLFVLMVTNLLGEHYGGGVSCAHGGDGVARGVNSGDLPRLHDESVAFRVTWGENENSAQCCARSF